MNNIQQNILNVNETICKNIEKFAQSERGLLSQNILAQLRNLVEQIFLNEYSHGKDIDNNYKNIVKAIDYAKTRGELRFLNRFHKLLQISSSHYTLDEENSERLMLKYYKSLLEIKNFLKNKYDLEVFQNLNDFPLDIDKSQKPYYEAIANVIEHHPIEIESIYNERYYIQKIKPFFVNNKIYYEITFILANDKRNKFDRIIAFTKLEILKNYAVNLSIKVKEINILDKEMPILIIDNWEPSIRPCELNNFAKILGKPENIKVGSTEYKNLMFQLKSIRLNLVELIDLPNDSYIFLKGQILLNAKNSNIFDILDACRYITINNKKGNNVIRYLLYYLNNRIIKKQFRDEPCSILSNLFLKFGCIPFDQMPFNTSLINHNPKVSDLLDCINTEGREHELLARQIKNNTETKGELYTNEKELENFENIDELIKKYNRSLYPKHVHRRIETFKDFLYIKGYEQDTHDILQIIKSYSISGVKKYSDSVDSWLAKSAYVIDCEEKKKALREMFVNSKVALIYGSAGTGKSTIINHLSNFLNDKSKLYLANTNPAVDNLKRKIEANNCTFRTIASFLMSNTVKTDFDILIIDECSTVNNKDMLEVLKKATFKLLVLVGDIYQIESITFGNWFSMAKKFISKESITELTKPYRSDNAQLITFWDKIRNIDKNKLDNIVEIITKNNYSKALDESIFEQSQDDEIILCLNYDGLYGINNINRFLQNNNESSPFLWGVHTYKINDPVLFNESERFGSILYNNLKGKIIDIKIFTDRIRFDVEIDKVLNDIDVWGTPITLLDCDKNDKSLIRFSVNKNKSTDEDDDSFSDTIVPFQVAYAISIHKAQGLEYNSVKIVITNEINEMISHNIFYTAITRAKEKLKIYWTPETERKILDNLTVRDSGRDAALFAIKFKP